MTNEIKEQAQKWLEKHKLENILKVSFNFDKSEIILEPFKKPSNNSVIIKNKSIEEFPYQLGDVTELTLENCNLKSFKNFPKNIQTKLNVSKNPQLNLKDLPPYNCQLIAKYNNIKNIEIDSLINFKILDFSHNIIEKIDLSFFKYRHQYSFSSKIYGPTLNLSHNQIKEVSSTNQDNIIYSNLNISNNKIKKIDFEKGSIDSLDLSFNEIDNINIKNINISYLNINNNKLENLYGFPEKIQMHIDLSFNELESLEGDLKVVGGKFHCNNNKLKSLKGIPQISHGLNLSNNFLENLNEINFKIKSHVMDINTKRIGLNINDNPLSNLENLPAMVPRLKVYYKNQIFEQNHFIDMLKKSTLMKKLEVNLKLTNKNLNKI